MENIICKSYKLQIMINLKIMLCNKIMLNTNICMPCLDSEADDSSGSVHKQGDSNTQLTFGRSHPMGSDSVDAWTQEAKLYHNPSVYDVVVPRHKVIQSRQR